MRQVRRITGDFSELEGVNPDCDFCHGEGFRRVPAFEGRWVYCRVGCASCFTKMVKARLEETAETAETATA